MTYQEWYQADRQNRLQIAARKVRAARAERERVRAETLRAQMQVVRDRQQLAGAVRRLGARWGARVVIGK